MNKPLSYSRGEKMEIEKTEVVKIADLPQILKKGKEDGYYIRLWISGDEVYGAGFRAKKRKKEEVKEELTNRLKKYETELKINEEKLKKLLEVDPSVIGITTKLIQSTKKKISKLKEKVAKTKEKLEKL